MKSTDVKFWKCSCGKKHPILDGQPIYCSGPGHSVYLSPEYWTYDPKKPKQQKQLTLL